MRMHLRDSDGPDQTDPEDAWFLLHMHVCVMRRSVNVKAPEDPSKIDFLPTRKKFSLRVLLEIYDEVVSKFAIYQLILAVMSTRLRERFAPDVDHFSRHRLSLRRFPFHVTWENELQNYLLP